jgi:hypothetical protein
MTVCLDGVCVCNCTLEQQVEHRPFVIQRFKQEGLKLRFDNCFFDLKEMEYLGCTATLCQIVKCQLRLRKSRPLHTCPCLHTEGGSQLRAILQLLRQVHPSFYRPYGSIGGRIAEVSFI